MSTPTGRFDPQSLHTLESREIEYAEARIFRALVIPRMFVFIAVVFAVVTWLHLSWRPIGAATALASGSVVLAVRTEWQARRRWMATAKNVAMAMGLRPKNGTQPTVQSGDIEDAPDRPPASFEVDQPAPADAPAGSHH